MADYLIIAPSKFHNDLEGLRELRGEKTRVQVADPEQIYAATPAGTTREEAIQSFVRELHRRTGGELKYLLLVGDDTPADLPEEIPVGKYGNAIHSDAYYGNITGDDLPEIAVGRLPATSAEGVRDFVAKIVEYEKGTQSQALQNRLSFYAGQGNFGPVEDLLLEAFVYALLQRRLPRSYQLDLHYDAEGSVFNTGRTFAEMLNTGGFALTYMGHGAPDLLAATPPFGPKDAETIAIENGLLLLILMACSAGCFANNDCLGEQLALLRHGPAAVIGSNETISPPVLQFFGDRMAEYLEKNGKTTIGEVFLHAQRHLADENDFLWRVLKELPASLAERAGLTGGVEEAILRQGLQMSLMGDPAMTWRLPKPSGKENGEDARLKGPQTGRMRERISPPLPQGEGRGKGGLSTKTLRYEDLETVLSLVDYLLYRVPDLVGKDNALLPKPGSVTLDHGIVRVPFSEPVTVPSRELPPYLKQLFFPAGLGELRFEKQFSFSAAFENGVATLEDVAGVTLLPDNNEKRALEGLKINLNDQPPRFEAQFGLPPISREEAEIENARLGQLFAGQPVKLQLEWNADGQRADYVLLRKAPGNSRFVPERKLFRVDGNHLPSVLEGRGILLTLPYGTRVGYAPDDAILVLNEVPAGEKTQSYLLVPFAGEGNRVPPHDPDSAIPMEIRQALRLKDRPIPGSTGGAFQWPLYAFYVHKEPPTFQSVSFATASWVKGPLFARKPSATEGVKPGPEEETSPESESGFSFSGLSRTGAEVCLVLDGSGSMGLPIENAWTALRDRVEDIPSLVRPFIKGALVAVRRGEISPLVGELTRMTDSGVQKFDRVIREFVFQGEEGNLQSGIEACRKIVTPNPDGSVYRGIFVLSDVEGMERQGLKTGFGIEAMAVDRALELPGVGDILKPTETGAVQKTVTALLTRSLVPKKRATAIAETMAPYFPRLRADEKKIWEMTTGYLAQQKSSPERVTFFEEQLDDGAAAERSERTTEMIVAAMALLPPKEFEILWPRLATLQEQAIDEPLRKTLAETKGKIAAAAAGAARGGKQRPTQLQKELAEDYYQQTFRDPEAVPLEDLEALLIPGSPAVDALFHIAQYGSLDRQLWALRIMENKSVIITTTISRAEIYYRLNDIGHFDPYLRKSIRKLLSRLGYVYLDAEEEP